MALRNALGVAFRSSPASSSAIRGRCHGRHRCPRRRLLRWQRPLRPSRPPHAQRPFFVSLAVFAGRLFGHNHPLTIALEVACASPPASWSPRLHALRHRHHHPRHPDRLLRLARLLLRQGPHLRRARLCRRHPADPLLPRPLARQPLPPESRALALLYAEMAHSAASSAPATEAPPATDTILAARSALAGLDADRSVEAERYLALFSQAERIRLALLDARPPPRPHRPRTRDRRRDRDAPAPANLPRAS